MLLPLANWHGRAPARTDVLSRVLPPDAGTPVCVYVASGNVTIWSRRNWVGERWPYFCDPHSPWRRGGIENANGLLRRDLPRSTALADYTDADIDDFTWNLNATPRKCFGYRTPIEAFAANLGVALEM